MPAVIIFRKEMGYYNLNLGFLSEKLSWLDYLQTSA